METVYTFFNDVWNAGLSALPLIIVSLLFIVGIVSTVLPILPGNIIVWLGVLVHKLWLGEQSLGWKWVIAAAFIALLAQAADWACTYWGAKRFGASWRGGVGALIGVFIAIFVPPPLFWIFFGPFVGAVLGEMTANRPFAEARRAGVGSFLGGLAAMGVKMFLAALTVIGFYTLLGMQ